jgi:hypothetical protein
MFRASNSCRFPGTSNTVGVNPHATRAPSNTEGTVLPCAKPVSLRVIATPASVMPSSMVFIGQVASNAAAYDILCCGRKRARNACVVEDALQHALTYHRPPSRTCCSLHIVRCVVQCLRVPWSTSCCTHLHPGAHIAHTVKAVNIADVNLFHCMASRSILAQELHAPRQHCRHYVTDPYGTHML